MRELVAYFFVLIMLAISFVLILWLAHKEIQYQRVFPATNCTEINNIYGSDIEQYAYWDYVFVDATTGQASNGCL